MTDTTGGELLLRNARPYAGGKPFDVLIADGVIGAVGDSESRSAGKSTEEVDLQGRWIGPGLWDEHVHFTQWVHRRQRIDLSATDCADDILKIIAAAGPDAPRTGGALIGYGFRDGLWPEPPTLADLDRVAPTDPVVMVSADLHSAWLNTPAARLLGVVPDAAGLLREGPWIAALQRLQDSTDVPVAAYAEATAAAARRGVVGITDYENAPNAQDWADRVGAGADQLRVDASVWPDRLDAAIAHGRRTGDLVEPRGLVRMGRLKIVVDGSLNTRTAWCHDPYPDSDPTSRTRCGVASVPPDRLRELLRRSADHGIDAAVHAIGDRANSEVLSAFAELGITGIIEHAQLIGDDDLERFARLGVIASVQPEHAMDDRDVADRFWPGRTGRAFAFGSLHTAGVQLRLGSDAPVAPLDPWQAIAAATFRSRDGREPWHPEQRLSLRTALASSARGRDTVQVGQVADLVVVDHDPYVTDGDLLRTMPVAATLVGGRFTWRDL